MSFLKRIFGGRTDEAGGKPKTVGEAVEHNGFTIRATPFSEAGQFQTCGIVTREIGGEMKEHTFIRADRFTNQDEAAAHSIRKGIQLVDEQGDRLFQ